jgi:putative FmdB family regulatory protein
MPIYEYKCIQCGNEFEQLMKLDSPSPPCTKALKTDNPKFLVRCDGKTTKLISKGNFHLKGPGWAKDGYNKNYVFSHPDALGADDSKWHVTGE